MFESPKTSPNGASRKIFQDDESSSDKMDKIKVKKSIYDNDDTVRLGLSELYDDKTKNKREKRNNT